MKVIGLVALILGIAAMLASGPGVPTQGSSVPNATAPTVNPGTSIPTLNNTGLNPRHGEPGHRCDIPVGQPLNSKPIAPASKLTVPAASILPTTPATNVVPVAPATSVLPSSPASGLNPKHGQPGHRCDIPVGQPLNSKPSLPVTPSATTTTPTATVNPTGVPPKLNPKHGQPFHRCDILVGQPLDSKPTLPVVNK